MVEKKAPAYQWYVNDARSDRVFQRMTYAQKGMYREMLDEQWDNGGVGLPDCPRACAELLGGTDEEWLANWPVLRRKFVDRRSRPRHGETSIPRDSDPSRHIINLRLEKQRRAYRKFTSAQREAGRKGGLSKAEKTKGLLAGDPRGSLSEPRKNPSEPLAKSSSSLLFSASSSASASAEREERVPLTAVRIESMTDGERIARFMDRYSDLHRAYLGGVDYIGNPQADYQECLRFVPKFTEVELETLMVYWFNVRDKFTEGTRSIAKFRSRISGMQQELQAKGLWTATSATAKVS